MKGRGTRTCSLDELKAKGTPSAKFSKDHFVIIDAIGVERSQKTDSRPLEKAPGVSLKDVLQSVAMGNTSEEMLTTLANRLIRLEKQLSTKEKQKLEELTGGKTISQLAKSLIEAHDPDKIEQIQTAVHGHFRGEAPVVIESEIRKQHEQLIEQAVAVFHNPDLREYIVDVRKKYDQIIDVLNIDSISKIGWAKDNSASNEAVVSEFKAWIEENKDEITALQIFYSQEYRNRALSYTMIKELYEQLKLTKPTLAPLAIWNAYEQLEKANGSPKNELTALVALIRRVLGIDETLTSYDKTVDKNFQDWVFKKQAGTLKFTAEQMDWLRMIKDYIANSFHIDKDDFEYDPFNKNGGLGMYYKMFGEQYEAILEELNTELIA
jgi:type I restriction enzyme R subunit